VGFFRKSNVFQKLTRSVEHLRFFPSHVTGFEEAGSRILTGLLFHAHGNVVQSRELAEDAHILKEDAYSLAGDFVRSEAEQICLTHSEAAVLSSIRRTDPLSGLRKPVMTLNSVVLPAPLGPMSAVTLAGGNSKETSSKATTPPNRLFRFSVRCACVNRRHTCQGFPGA